MFTVLAVLFISGYVIYVSAKSRPKSKKNSTDSVVQTKEIRYNGRLYDVTNFVKRHPGGGVIEFYVNNGEDATIPIQQFHYRTAKRVSLMLKSFKSRPIPEDFVLTEQDAKNQELTRDYLKLHNELKDEGLFEPSLVYVALRISEIYVFATLGMFLVTHSDGLVKTVTGLLLLNLFQMRAQFLVHEGGHHSLTGKPGLDRTIEDISFGVSSGLSGTIWRSQHNRHHAMPQRLHHDVDLKTLPLIAYNAAVMKGEEHRYNTVLKYQAQFLAPWTSTVGRLGWQLHLHPIYSFKSKNYQEFLYYALHYYGAYLIGFTPYMTLVTMNAAAMLLTFSMSHSHTPVTEEPRHWVEYATTHTINADPSWWCDYWTGYLNYQIDHHLFPTLPQFRLKAISGRVRALVEKHGLPYTCVSYGEAIRKVFFNLSAVSQELEQQAKERRM